MMVSKCALSSYYDSRWYTQSSYYAICIAILRAGEVSCGDAWMAERTHWRIGGWGSKSLSLSLFFVSLSPSLSLSLYLSVTLSQCLSISLSLSLYHRSIDLSIHPSIYQSISSVV